MNMKRIGEFLVVLVVVVLVVVASRPGGSPEPESTPTDAATTTAIDETADSPLSPLANKVTPNLSEVHQVKFQTDHGDFVVDVYPQAAPNAAERFLDLIDEGFYDGVYISRVVDNFVVQFGINPEMADWKDKHFNDDPTLYQLLPGTIAFAKAGPNTNSTQVFVNLTENNRLADPQYNFTVFGQISEGMDVIREFQTVGDPSMGLDQQRLWAEPDYPDSLEKKPARIVRAYRL